MASTSVIQQMLQQEILALPEGLAAEVLDFVYFLKVGRSEEAFLWQQVEATRAYRQGRPDHVRTVTVAEWLAEIADDSDLPA